MRGSRQRDSSAIRIEAVLPFLKIYKNTQRVTHCLAPNRGARARSRCSSLKIPFLGSKLGFFAHRTTRPTTASRQCAESRAAVKLSTVRDEGRDLVKTPGARRRCCFCSSRRAAPLQTRRRLRWRRPSPSHPEWSPPRNGGSTRCVVQIASRNVIAPRTTSALRSQNSQGSRCRTGAGRPVRPSPLQMPRSPPALS